MIVCSVAAGDKLTHYQTLSFVPYGPALVDTSNENQIIELSLSSEIEPEVLKRKRYILQKEEYPADAEKLVRKNFKCVHSITLGVIATSLHGLKLAPFFALLVFSATYMVIAGFVITAAVDLIGIPVDKEVFGRLTRLKELRSRVKHRPLYLIADTDAVSKTPNEESL